jgi:protein-L-isoaspartate(D-aspartate) O-methyltransferase
MTDYARARQTMVERQIMTAGVTDRAVLDALGDVPREMFAPAELRHLAYSDADLPITPADSGGPRRFLIEPAILARLAQLAGIDADDIVLDIGCGSGYSSAVLSRLAGSVVAVEEDSRLAAQATETLIELDIGNVAVVTAPLETGYPAEGPYDVIFLGGSVETVPNTLLGQLKEGARLVCVVGTGPDGMATCFRLVFGEISRRAAFSAAVPPLPGFSAPKVFQF